MSRTAWLEAPTRADLADALDQTTSADIARQVARTPPADLARLLADPERAAALVDRVLSALPDFVVAERLGGRGGHLRVEHTGSLQGRVDHLHWEETALRRVDPRDEADVVLSGAPHDLARLLTGSANASLLVLAGRLEVTGDVDLAFHLGGVFQEPERPGVAVDPTAVDADEVADVVRTVSDSHLESVMSGSFRPIVLGQVIRRFPEFLDPRKASGAALDVGFEVTGDEPTQTVRFTVHVAQGRCWVSGGSPASVDVTVTARGTDFIRLVTGQLSPVVGVVKRQLAVRGDLQAGLQLYRIMRIPGQELRGVKG